MTLSVFPQPLSIEQNYPPSPPTPSPAPASLQPAPLRYPETLGTLIEIHKAEDKGLGVFALRDLAPGTMLLCEAPMVMLQDDGARADPLDTAVDALSAAQKQSFFSLHAFTIRKNESRSRSIFYSNGYSIAHDLATGVFETASRINHSCLPNCQYAWKDRIGKMVFYSCFALRAGEEVTVDYGHSRSALSRIYGFECMCGGCTDSGSDGRSSRGSESARGEGMGCIEVGLRQAEG